jgi:1-acyl-sn-glycerol-3-phosphate acyltransferase
LSKYLEKFAVKQYHKINMREDYIGKTGIPNDTIQALETLIRYEPSPVLELRYDTKTDTLPAAIVSVMNGRRMGGSFFMGPQAILNDGLLDICQTSGHPEAADADRGKLRYPMNLRRTVVNAVIKRLVNILCVVDNRDFVNTLQALNSGKKNFALGPVILAVNHINFLEVPILVTHTYPLLLTGLVKEETWKNPIMAFLFDTCNAIPIDRNGSYYQTFQRVREFLDRGFFVCIAPEGTRSKNGVLGRGKAGVVQLALFTGAPVVHWGGENFRENLRRFKRTPFCFRVGRPFRFKCEGRPDRLIREQMLRELMGQMAALLPEEMRGIHAEQARRECQHLEFL